MLGKCATYWTKDSAHLLSLDDYEWLEQLQAECPIVRNLLPAYLVFAPAFELIRATVHAPRILATHRLWGETQPPHDIRSPMLCSACSKCGDNSHSSSRCKHIITSVWRVSSIWEMMVTAGEGLRSRIRNLGFHFEIGLWHGGRVLPHCY